VIRIPACGEHAVFPDDAERFARAFRRFAAKLA